MKAPHYIVDRQRWANMNILDQMGNISSEVGRSIKAKRQDNSEDFEAAVARALDLFDATTDILIQQKSVRVKEVLRAKDQFLHAVYDPDATLDDQNSIDRYFTQYAIASRINR